jgi:hypothetical protein
MDERGPAVAAFYTWLATNGLDVECPDHVKFRLATFPWTGRGTRATVPIHVRVLIRKCRSLHGVSPASRLTSCLGREGRGCSRIGAATADLVGSDRHRFASGTRRAASRRGHHPGRPHGGPRPLAPLREEPRTRLLLGSLLSYPSTSFPSVATRFVPLLPWWQQTKRNKPVQWIV